MKLFFSIIIPYHNSITTIGPLLDSIYSSKNAPTLEIIIVDDGSEKNVKCHPPVGGLNFQKRKFKRFNIKTIRFDKNKGPAKARNAGAGVARGKYLVFLDSDVRLYPDALYNLSKIYSNDLDAVAVTGVWTKHQKSDAFFPNFKALRDWSYWINERDVNGYYFLFSTRIASIRRDVFLRLGGFDEVYAGPLVEDIEFTYRIARRYAVIFAPNVRVHHEFEDFWPIAKKYFWRTYYWVGLFSQRKKFDPVATTKKEGMTALSGSLIVSLLLMYYGLFFLLRLSIVYPLPYQWQIWGNQLLSIVANVFVLLLIVHLFFVRKFLVYVCKEKGFVFAVRSFFVGIILYCFITAGAVWGKRNNSR